MSEPIACPECGSTSWTDEIQVTEILVLTLDTEHGQMNRAGRKYYEDRASDWLCLNGHHAPSELFDSLEDAHNDAEEV